MSIRLLLLSSALSVVALLAPHPVFACNPKYDADVSKQVICYNKACSQFGASTMDGDGKNIVACLKNDSGSLVWKAMTATSSGSATCFDASSTISKSMLSLNPIGFNDYGAGLNVNDVVTRSVAPAVILAFPESIHLVCKTPFTRVSCSDSGQFGDVRTISNGCANTAREGTTGYLGMVTPAGTLGVTCCKF